jgi:hypothetical protein
MQKPEYTAKTTRKSVISMVYFCCQVIMTFQGILAVLKKIWDHLEHK